MPGLSLLVAVARAWVGSLSMVALAVAGSGCVPMLDVLADAWSGAVLVGGAGVGDLGGGGVPNLVGTLFVPMGRRGEMVRCSIPWRVEAVSWGGVPGDLGPLLRRWVRS